jgi:hypothetical protein
MKPPGRWAVLATIAIVATLLAAAAGLQIVREGLPVGRRQAERYLYVPSDVAMKRLTVAFQALVADIYWIRAIQHYGGDRLSKGGTAKYELLYPLLDITTTLDPRFTIAYRFGAIFLAEPYPGGPGRPDLAIRLLEKGVRAEPRKWQYLHDIGFVHYWQYRDPRTAAVWFQRAAEVPGAPNWLKPLAGTMLIQGGDRRTSRLLWREIRESADQEWLRALAERRLLQLAALDALDRLAPLVERFAAQADPPYTWERIVRAGLLARVPRDPTGTPFALDPWSGAVRVSEQSPLYPMPTEPPPGLAPSP